MNDTTFVDVPVVDQWHIPDDLWEGIALLLPEHKNTHRFGGGRPRTPDRVCMEAILFVLRTGCQWKALNATRFCPSSTAHDRFQEWVKAGVFQQLWEAGLLAYDEWKGIDWSWLSMDGCMTKAPLGGEKDGQKPDRSRQEGGQAQPAGGRRRHPGGVGRGRRQPARQQVGGRDARQYPRRAARTHGRGPARLVPGQGVCR
jgi:putative transposase